VLHDPIRTAADVDRLAELDTIEPLGFVIETVRKTRAGLPEQLPLIGFAGAPFTLAAYAIEGGSSREFRLAKTLMLTDTGAWDALMGRLARAVTLYLNAQIDAGAQVVQLFDSWVGCLGVDDYRRYVLPHTRSVIEALPPDVPVIHFATGNPALLPLLGEAFGKKKRDAIVGVDWRIRLDDAWRAIGYDRAKDILRQAGHRPGHIFNLGHGVLPQTPVENVLALVEAVHEFSGR
jgi:uroporphyrinogen decarboxylase